jgi:hypothetical protein
VADWFASGRIVDVILVLMVLEAVALTLLRNKAQRGLSIYVLAANFSAGAALLLALRAALTDHRWQSVALWLVLALIAHATDLRARWVTMK